MTGPGNGTSERNEETRGTKLPPRVERRVRASRALLVFEALLPALWPAAGLAGFFVALALFGAFSSLPPALHWTLLAGFGGLFVWLLWRGFRGFRWEAVGFERGKSRPRTDELLDALLTILIAHIEEL